MSNQYLSHFCSVGSLSTVPDMILALQRWSAPPVLMLLCLLLTFNGKVERTVDVEYVEVFAGVAEISKACRAHGMIGSSHDINYSSHYDLCERTGFLYHGIIRFFELNWTSGFWTPIICSNCLASYIGRRIQLYRGVCSYGLVNTHSWSQPTRHIPSYPSGWRLTSFSVLFLARFVSSLGAAIATAECTLVNIYVENTKQLVSLKSLYTSVKIFPLLDMVGSHKGRSWLPQKVHVANFSYNFIYIYIYIYVVCFFISYMHIYLQGGTEFLKGFKGSPYASKAIHINYPPISIIQK